MSQITITLTQTESDHVEFHILGADYLSAIHICELLERAANSLRRGATKRVKERNPKTARAAQLMLLAVKVKDLEQISNS